MASSLAITTLYAGILTVMYSVLSWRIGLYRFNTRVLFGEGSKEKNKYLAYYVRAHGNFIEYVPLSLILLGLMEAQHLLSPYWLHAFGIAFTLTRISHAYQLSGGEGRTQRWIRFRMFGFVGTQAALGAAAFVVLRATLPGALAQLKA